MRKGLKRTLIALSVIGLIFLGVFLEYISLISQKQQLSLSPPIQNILLPKNCSNESIKAVWDTLFVENSNGIYVSTSTSEENKCSVFYAFKIKYNELYLLGGIDITFFANMQLISAMKGEFSDDYLNLIQGVLNGTYNESTQEYENFLVSQEDLNNLTSYALPRQITSKEEANTKFRTYFKPTPDLSEWIENETEENPGVLIYLFYRNISLETGATADIGMIMANYSIDEFIYINTSFEIPPIENCEPLWQIYNITCDSDEKIIETLIDNNGCNLFTKDEKSDIDCDYNKNNIIGSLSEISSNNIDKEVKINNSLLNNSNAYNLTQSVEILDENKTLVQFYWNFSSSPLNLRNITIKKQPSSSEKGYIIINGIHTNKIIYVDKLTSSSNSICIKNSEINSINEISSNCNKTDEILLPCSGTNSSFLCLLINSTFVISGLTNSAAEEFIESVNCEPFLRCSAWSECINRIQNRTCNDLNSCQASRVETQNCTIFELPLCIESWNCTDWQPEKCPKNEIQTKTCIDKNNCGTTNIKPITSQSCIYKKENKTWIFIVIITLIILISIITIAILIYYFKNKNQKEKEDDSFYY